MLSFTFFIIFTTTSTQICQTNSVVESCSPGGCEGYESDHVGSYVAAAGKSARAARIASELRNGVECPIDHRGSPRRFYLVVVKPMPGARYVDCQSSRVLSYSLRSAATADPC